jgi:hypothetical protein
MKNALILTGLTLVALFAFYLGFLHYTDNYQTGISWNVFTGEIKLDDHAGWHVTSPWVFVSRVDLRPTRVCITSAAHGAFNCKIVQFDPAYYREFVTTQGFYYWWWANRISFNFGYREEYRGMRDLMRGYAFSDVQYPFVHTIGDLSGQ